MNSPAAAMFLVMTLLRERLNPIDSAEPRNTSSGSGPQPLWVRYAELVKLGFSPETSMIVAEAPLTVDAVRNVLVPDGRPT